MNFHHFIYISRTVASWFCSRLRVLINSIKSVVDSFRVLLSLPYSTVAQDLAQARHSSTNPKLGSPLPPHCLHIVYNFRLIIRAGIIEVGIITALNTISHNMRAMTGFSPALRAVGVVDG